MKLICDYLLMSRMYQTTRFFLLSLFLLTLIPFSSAVSSVSAQDRAEVCRQTQTIIERYEREKERLEPKRHYKETEDLLRENLSEVGNATANGRLLKQGELEILAENIRLSLPKNIGQMTLQEGAAFQRRARAFLIKQIEESDQINLEDLDHPLERIEQQLSPRPERHNALHCGVVWLREKENTRRNYS